jgi:hypothetical protein
MDSSITKSILKAYLILLLNPITRYFFSRFLADKIDVLCFFYASFPAIKKFIFYRIINFLFTLTK